MASDKPITAQQAADLLIVSARVIYRLIESGELMRPQGRQQVQNDRGGVYCIFENPARSCHRERG